jgi:hypothetical protein
MKKALFAITIFTSVITMNIAHALVENDFSQQLAQQKTQLRPQEFNFFSDRYKQTHAVVNKSQLQKNSLKKQMDEQKAQLRPQEFNFFSDRYKQINAQKVVTAPSVTTFNEKLSFKQQLLTQKTQLRFQEFNFFSDKYKQVQALKTN